MAAKGPSGPSTNDLQLDSSITLKPYRPRVIDLSDDDDVTVVVRRVVKLEAKQLWVEAIQRRQKTAE